MKKYLVQAFSLFLLLASTSLFSFKAPLGGEGYHILINNKLIMEHYGSDLNMKKLDLQQYPADAKITIRYFHCGKLGKNRTVTLKDENGNIVKEWKYADAAEINSGVTCTVKEIQALQKNHQQLSLYYASTELPKGRMLAKL